MYSICRNLAQEVEFPTGIGPPLGINVAVNTSDADYYYPLLNYAGVYVLIFDTMEFSDPNTGNTRTEMIDSESETFIKISVVAFEADPEVKNYDVKKVFF